MCIPIKLGSALEMKLKRLSFFHAHACVLFSFPFVNYTIRNVFPVNKYIYIYLRHAIKNGGSSKSNEEIYARLIQDFKIMSKRYQQNIFLLLNQLFRSKLYSFNVLTQSYIKLCKCFSNHGVLMN